MVARTHLGLGTSSLTALGQTFSPLGTSILTIEGQDLSPTVQQFSPFNCKHLNLKEMQEHCMFVCVLLYIKTTNEQCKTLVLARRRFANKCMVDSVLPMTRD